MRDNKGRFIKEEKMDKEEGKIIKGYAFHCHHDTLVEWVTDFNERIVFIVKNKPTEEWGVRFNLFKMIPWDRLPDSLLHHLAGKAEARVGWLNALAVVDEDYFIKLHDELCPSCPWNGKTIFTER